MRHNFFLLICHLFFIQSLLINFMFIELSFNFHLLIHIEAFFILLDSTSFILDHSSFLPLFILRAMQTTLTGFLVIFSFLILYKILFIHGIIYRY